MLRQFWSLLSVQLPSRLDLSNSSSISSNRLQIQVQDLTRFSYQIFKHLTNPVPCIGGLQEQSAIAAPAPYHANMRIWHALLCYAGFVSCPPYILDPREKVESLGARPVTFPEFGVFPESRAGLFRFILFHSTLHKDLHKLWFRFRLLLYSTDVCRFKFRFFYSLYTDLYKLRFRFRIFIFSLNRFQVQICNILIYTDS